MGFLLLLRISFCVLLIAAVVAADAFEFEEGFLLKPEKCYKICKEGGCYFKDCQEPKCPGGACYFVNCKKPSCTGSCFLLPLYLLS